MATLASKKKTPRFIVNKRDGSSFVSDSASPGSVSVVSDSRVIRCNKRKSQKSTKDYSIKPKIGPNIFGVREAFNATENVKKIRSVSSEIIIRPSFLINEGSKRHNGMEKEKMHLKNLAKRLIAKRKTTVHKTGSVTSKEKKKSIVSNLNNKSNDFENSSNYAKKSQLRFNSLFDFEKDQNVDATFLHRRQNSFSVTPSGETVNFSNVKSRHRKSRFDYLKEFDLIRFRGSKELVELSEDETIFSLVPKISPSDPVVLPRRKYKHCVMSVKDSKDVSHETKGNDSEEISETTMNIEFENTDKDNKCLEDTWFANDKNYVLVAKKPIRIKCIDEATNGIRDIIIYSDEFLKDILKEKGKCGSKKEIYESILKESSDYSGKSLRIIIDAEKYFRCVDKKWEYRDDIKTEFSENPKKSSKSLEHARKMSSRIPRCTKSYASFYSSNQTKKKASTEENTPLINDNSTGAIDAKSADVNLTELGDSNPGKNKRSESAEILKKEKKKFEFINKRKSRTALKKINVEIIIGSSFSYYFHFYAKLGRSLKSGIAISKTNSTSWLKKCGIVPENITKSVAEKYFIAIACTKCVLNISDYIKYLNKIANDRHMLLVDILYRMMSVDLHSLKKTDTDTKQETKQCDKGTTKNSTLEIKSKQTLKSKCTKLHQLDNNPKKNMKRSEVKPRFVL